MMAAEPAYAYARNNPIRYADSTGLCIDPGGPGTRICISAYIPTATAAAIFQGDNRGPNPNGGTYRAQTLARFNAQGQVTYYRFDPGITHFANGRGALKAMNRGDGFSVNDGWLRLKGAASDPYGWYLAPPLSYDLRLKMDANHLKRTCGKSPVVHGSRTAYPALEVWLYEDNQPPFLLYSYDPIAVQRDLHDIIYDDHTGF